MLLSFKMPKLLNRKIRESIHVLMVKNLPANAGDTGSIPRLGRSPGQGNGNPFQYSPESHGQRSLACYSSWGCKESGTTQQLNNNNVYS